VLTCDVAQTRRERGLVEKEKESFMFKGSSLRVVSHKVAKTNLHE